ncbi:hypothetical protein NH44784_062281 [Achromobacter xylosoxidans NH44784-1996]|nr:hypothetical protein NH44784_062281 [Achromobacter xylosoxidans NH44784-1996]
MVPLGFWPISVKLSGFTDSGPGASRRGALEPHIYGIPCNRRRR